MWEQEGGEIMLVAPLCVRMYASVYCTRVSGYAAHRKQTAAKIPPQIHTHTETQPHTHKADSRRHKRQKTHRYDDTHTHKTPLNQRPMHRCVLKCHVHTHLCTHTTHFPYTPNTHIPPPT